MMSHNVLNLVHLSCMVLSEDCIKYFQNGRHCGKYLIPHLHNLCKIGKMSNFYA